MRFIVFIVTFLLQSQSQPIQETNESEIDIVCSSKVNCSNDNENISRNDDDDSIFETSEKNDDGKTTKGFEITIVFRRP